jgi:hypothetical protein
VPDHLFPLGIVTATPAALEQLASFGVDHQDLLDRHARGDFGTAAQHAVERNQGSIQEKVGTILSIYDLGNGSEIWVAASIYEPGEVHTCILCPGDW